MANKSRFLPLVCFLLLSIQVGGQEILSIEGVDCNLHGSANPHRPEYELNEYKNRYKLPQKSDYISDVSLQQLIDGNDGDQFPLDKAIILTGYVFNVKTGGVETCNCKTKDQKFRDTHIEITPDENHTSAEYRIVVEVTPRIRAIMAVKGIDWSTDELKRTLIGHRIKVAGWLFYDAEHKSQAFATNPTGERNWRASCWEIHPITYIKVLN